MSKLLVLFVVCEALIPPQGVRLAPRRRCGAGREATASGEMRELLDGVTRDCELTLLVALRRLCDDGAIKRGAERKLYELDMAARGKTARGGSRAGIVEAVSATGVTDDDALELAVEVVGGAGGFGAAAAPETQVVTVPLDMRNEGGAPSATDLKRALLRLCLTIDEPTGAAKLLRLQAGRNPGAELPDDCRFNNVPYTRQLRSFLNGGVLDAVNAALYRASPPPGAVDAAGAPLGRGRFRITLTVPETNPAMDTFRIGTVLELVRKVALALVDDGATVRVCVQGSMGEGVLAGLPLSLAGVRKILELMDWDDSPGAAHEGVLVSPDGEDASDAPAAAKDEAQQAGTEESPAPPRASSTRQRRGRASSVTKKKPSAAEEAARLDEVRKRLAAEAAAAGEADAAEAAPSGDGGDAPLGPAPGRISFGAVGAEHVDPRIDAYIIIAPQPLTGASIYEPLSEMCAAAGAAGAAVFLYNPRLTDKMSAAGVMSFRGREERLAFEASFTEAYCLKLLYPAGAAFNPILGALCRTAPDEPYVLMKRVGLGRGHEEYVPIGVYDDEPERGGYSDMLTKDLD